MDEFFSWQMLATFAGSTAATGILTQFLKNLIPKLPTQWLSYLLALVLPVSYTHLDVYKRQMLLGSPPDMVPRLQLRKANSSTLLLQHRPYVFSPQ